MRLPEPARVHPFALFLLVGSAYAVGSQLAFTWFGADGLGASFFPAAGVTMAALLLLPRRRWPIVLVAAGIAELSVDLWHDLDLVPTLGYVAANLAQPVVGALALGAVARQVDLSRTRDLAAFIACAVVGAPVVGGSIGASSFVVLDGGDGWARIAAEWWVGDGLGILVVGGAILAFWASSPRPLASVRIATGVVLGTLAVLATVALFRLESFGFVYVPIVLLALVAFRVGTRGVAVTGAAIAFVAAQATADGSRYWEALEIPDSTGLLYLQTALAVLVAATLALAAEIAERERTGVELARTEAIRAAAMERATLADTERRARVHAESLGRSAALLAETSSMADVARAAVRVVLEWGASRASFAVVEDGRLVVRAAAGRDDQTRAADASELAWEPLAGEAVRQGAPVVVQDPTELELWHARGEALPRPSPGTVAAYPLAVPDGGLSAVLVGEAAEADWVTPERHDLLTALTDQVVVAAERAVLLAREKADRRRAEILEAHASRLASAFSVETVAQTTLVDLESLGAAAAWVQVRRGASLELVESSGVPEENRERYAVVPLDAEAPTAEAVRTGTLVAVGTGAELDLRYPNVAAGRTRLGYESIVSIPLRATGDRVLGALTFTSPEPNWLDDDRRRLVVGLAAQCGLALERAQLQREADQAAADAALLAALGEVLERPTTMHGRAEALVDALVPDRAALAATCAFDDENALRVVACAGTGATDAAILTLAAETAATRAITERAVGSLMLVGVPLGARDRTLGALVVGASPQKPGRMTPVLAHRIATRAALALDNALLYEAERSVSHSLQLGLLGGGVEAIPGTRAATAYRPGSSTLEVGGDWYDAFPLPGGRLGFLVGDVVGHGLEAAVAMGQLRGAVRALARVGAPSEVLRRLDDFVETLPEAGMATIAYGELAPDGAIVYACAGHPPPLLVPSAGPARLLWDGRSPPLGSSFGHERVEAADQLEPGDTIVLYTDGLVERRSQAVSLRLTALASSAEAAGAGGPGALVQHLLATMLEDEVQDDDVCVLAVNVTADPVRFTYSFPAAAHEVANMRRALSHWLAQLDLDAQAVYDTTLAVSEAAANGAEHAYGFDGNGVIHVDAVVRGARLEVEVRDSGRWRAPALESDRGRGRVIMDAVMETVDIQAGESGTTVRMTAPLRARARS